MAPVTPLSRRFLTTIKALTSRRASLRPFGLCLIASLIPPALRPCGMNTLIGNTTRSPQVRRFSFSPCRPHTPCLRARCASISFALELQARFRALLADRFASGLSLGYGPEFRRRPFGFHLAVNTLPSLCSQSTGPPVYPACCLRFPLARVRRNFHPLEKRPAGRTTLIRHYFERARPARPEAVGIRAHSLT
jgi:hypothetical protein